MTSNSPDVRPTFGSDAPSGTTDPGWLRHVTIVALIAAVAVLAASMARPMVTYRAIGLGASPVEIGFVQSAYALLPMLTAIAVGRWVDRVGEARILALGCIALAIGALALVVANSLLVLTAGQVAMGFGIITTAIAAQSSVANRGPAERAVHRFGWFSVTISIGQIAGPLIAALLVSAPASGSSIGATSGPAETIVFVAAAAGSLVALALIWLLPRRLASSGTPGMVVRVNLGRASARMLRTPGFVPAVFVSLAVSSGVDMLIVYLPAYGDSTGLSVTTVGGLLAVRAAATLVSRAFMGRMTDRLGLGRTLVFTTGIAAVCVALLTVIAPVPLMFVLVGLIGFGLGIGQPLTVALIGLQSHPTERGLAFGVRHTGNLAALVLVPVVMGAVADASGIGAVWLVLAGLLGSATVVAGRTSFARIPSGARALRSAVELDPELERRN